ncbi:MAG: hypothetical protein DIU78_003010 [Pseudomonadota bacterium]|nr:MAG: hypothetical protein DIU78_17155 [Pseudomonadota bacterium]
MLRSIASRLVSVLLLGGTAVGLYNVYGDNSAVKALAEEAACGKRTCSVTFTRESRSPIGQSFTVQTRLVARGSRERSASVDVECRRSFYLVGEYSCRAQGALPEDTAAASP